MAKADPEKYIYNLAFCTNLGLVIGVSTATITILRNIKEEKKRISYYKQIEYEKYKNALPK